MSSGAPGLQPLPPGTVPVLLVGGPCDGEFKDVPLRVAQGGALTCQQVTYVPDPGDTNWPPHAPYTLERWITAQAAAKVASAAPAVKAKNAQGAWLRLMVTLYLYVPGQLNRQRVATAQLRRISRRRSRR